jgi:hypothetical protein
VLWIVAVVLLAASAVTAKVSFARPASDAQRNQAATYEIALAVVVVSSPVLTAMLAPATGHWASTVVLLVLAALLLVPAVLVGHLAVQDGHAGTVTPEPVVTQCIPRSGSARGCPGG